MYAMKDGGGVYTHWYVKGRGKVLKGKLKIKVDQLIRNGTRMEVVH